MKTIIPIATFTCLVLSGCASSSREKLEALQIEQQKESDAHFAEVRKTAELKEKNRIAVLEAYLRFHPELSEDEKKAIAEQRPIVGLTVEESYVLVGEMLKVSENGGLGGTWQIWETVRGDKRELFFHEGRLVRWYELGF